MTYIYVYREKRVHTHLQHLCRCILLFGFGTKNLSLGRFAEFLTLLQACMYVYKCMSSCYICVCIYIYICTNIFITHTHTHTRTHKHIISPSQTRVSTNPLPTHGSLSSYASPGHNFLSFSQSPYSKQPFPAAAFPAKIARIMRLASALSRLTPDTPRAGS